MSNKIAAAQKNPVLGKFLFCVILGVIIYFFMPAENGLTPLGVKLLSVFIPTVVCWLIIGGTGWSALLSVTMIVLQGVYDGNLTYQMQWGTALIAMVIPFFMLAYVLEKSGAIEYFVKWLISRKIVHGRPKLFMVIFAVSLIIINAFVHLYVVMVLYFKILKQIATDIGETETSSFYTAHGLLIGWISQFCDGTLIWMRPWIASMVAIIASYGFSSFTISEFLKLSFLYLVVATVVLLLLIGVWVRPDLSKLKNFDDAAMREELKKAPMSKTAKIAFIGMGVVMLCNVIATVSFLGPVSSYFAALPYAAPVTLVVTLLAIIYVEGKPVIDLGEAARYVPWETLMFLGAIMFYASIFGGDEYGVNLLLQNLLTPLVNGIPLSVAILLGLAGACIFTNLASNSVAVIVAGASFIPAMLNIPGINHAQVLAFGACIILASGTAICTRSACGAMALFYAKEHLPWNRKILSYGIVICTIMILFAFFVLVPLGTNIYAGVV